MKIKPWLPHLGVSGDESDPWCHKEVGSSHLSLELKQHLYEENISITNLYKTNIATSKIRETKDETF